MPINEQEILKAINETLYKDSKKEKKQMSESYVVQAKKYDLNTDMLSKKAIGSQCRKSSGICRCS